MIIGIETDLIDVRRITGVSQRYGKRFWRRILNDDELSDPIQEPSPLVLAKRFAAKEACAKAMGTGISQDLSWHDMTVLHGCGGPPKIILTSASFQGIQRKIGGNEAIKLDLSLSDKYPYVQAFVVISYQKRSIVHGSE